MDVEDFIKHADRQIELLKQELRLRDLEIRYLVRSLNHYDPKREWMKQAQQFSYKELDKKTEKK